MRTPIALASAALPLVLTACGIRGPVAGPATPSPSPSPVATIPSPTLPAPSAPVPSAPESVPPSVVPTSALPSSPAAPRGTFDLTASGPDCSYVPNGGTDGRDVLNAGFHIVLVGASDAGRLVPVRASSDTGLAGSVNASANNRGETIIPLSLRDSDYGRTHRITIEIDPANEIAETDDLNNTLTFSVTLPHPRPTSAIGNLPCS